MPASRQNDDCCSAGAIWCVLKLPRPHKAKPILRFGSAANVPSSGKPATASVEVFKKSRRETNRDFVAAAYARRSGRDKLKRPATFFISAIDNSGRRSLISLSHQRIPWN